MKSNDSKLIKKNYHVHVLLSKNSNLWRIKELKKHSSFHFVDLEKESEIEKIIKKIKPKTIFHLAAHGAYSFQKNKKKIKKVNFDATVSLVENCKTFGFTKFINTGSSSEYGFRNNKMAEKDTKEEILKAFKLFDDDESGKISFINLKRVAKELGENLSDEELQEMIDEADRDGDGEVNQDEFLRIMKKTSLY